ncbi:glycosyltransferase [Aquabacterium sp. OR-4]|uniref:glycosyltransferase n=1 Tax=Aquabacterium sp. OR-4 TaxID=2978127 RepID=UPI0028C8BEA9|nr:glycosyltransferase [Aquabacterium sp. OR-4]MDT7838924.1 glycosyltransferase [Aquabacterium sp. OR-4]
MLFKRIEGAGGKLLLTCSTGGHLAELLRLEGHVGRHADSLWVTFDTPQSRHLLAGRRVQFIPYIGPRDLRGTIASARAFHHILKRERFDGALSTGAAVAVAGLSVAAAHGLPASYVESFGRVLGPSLTGRLLARVPGVALLTQHADWARGHWRACDSILAGFRRVDAPQARPIERVFVTLGTMQGYRFDSVVDALLKSRYVNERTVWQLGHTQRRDRLPGRVHDILTPDRFCEAVRGADVVISHAGVGTLVELLNMGVYPVQAVRRAERREHVDNHQCELGDLVNRIGIGIAVDGPAVSDSVIEEAARWRMVDCVGAGAQAECAAPRERRAEPARAREAAGRPRWADADLRAAPVHPARRP